MCRYQEWNRETHAMGYCDQGVVTDSLCQEHLEWIEDCRAPGASKVDAKYGYKLPRRKAVKLEAPQVSETLYEPGHFAAAYKAYVKTFDIVGPPDPKAKGPLDYYPWYFKGMRPAE